MDTLFPESGFLGYKFPEPQYLGAKYVHRGWIAQHIPRECGTILDAFAGSQSIAYLAKQLGKTVVTNDLMLFDSEIGTALIENKGETLGEGDVEVLMRPNRAPGEYNLIEGLYAGLFFNVEDARFIDSFRSNVELLEGKYKRALALTVLCRSLTRKVTMGHFAHTKALEYARDPERVRRNRSLIRPVRDIFYELLPLYNAAVFDNRRENVSWNGNILDILPGLSGIDVAYFDPPYCDSHADYQSFYHLLETVVVYWKEKRFVNGTRRYEPKRYSGFDRKSDSLGSLRRLFELSEGIPVWLVSYNDRSFPTIEGMLEMLRRYRDVRVERKAYSSGRGGKGSVAGSSEVLFVCEPK